MIDRAGTNDLQNGAVRYGVYDENGVLLRHEWLLLADEPLVEGTPLTKATLLTDAVSGRIWFAGNAPTNPTVNDALSQLTNQRYKVGDLLVTVRELDAPWHTCDGSTFSQTEYPDLYAVLGGTTLPKVSYSSDTGTYILMSNH